MKRTSIAALVGAYGFMVALLFIATSRFYSYFPGIPVAVSVTLWVMAIVCTYCGIKVRSRRKDGRIGQDRNQLNPVTAAQFLVLGKASAWTGAIIGGAYAGIALYVVPRAGELIAAGDDMAGVLASALGGVLLSAAGVFLERSCEVVPPTDGEAVR